MSPVDPAVITALQQFLYREARLLDERRHGEWLELLSEGFRYRIPVRHTTGPDAEKRGDDAMWLIDRELAGDGELCLVDETRAGLAERVARSRKLNAWADNPPARTRHVVTNIELVATEADGTMLVCSNIVCHCYRLQGDTAVLTGQRIDRIASGNHGLQLAARTVILDEPVLPVNFLNVYL